MSTCTDLSNRLVFIQLNGKKRLWEYYWPSNSSPAKHTSWGGMRSSRGSSSTGRRKNPVRIPYLPFCHDLVNTNSWSYRHNSRTLKLTIDNYRKCFHFLPHAPVLLGSRNLAQNGRHQPAFSGYLYEGRHGTRVHPSRGYPEGD